MLTAIRKITMKSHFNIQSNSKVISETWIVLRHSQSVDDSVLQVVVNLFRIADLAPVACTELDSYEVILSLSHLIQDH